LHADAMFVAITARANVAVIRSFIVFILFLF